MSELRDAVFIASDSKSLFKNVIAKRSDLVKFTSGRMVLPGSGTVTHYAGEVLGYATSGGDAGKWKPYLTGSSDGSQVAKGVLANTTVVGADGSDSEIAIITGGQLLKDLLIGLDSGAITNLNAKTLVEKGVNILDF